jgi:hypothetical protein
MEISSDLFDGDQFSFILWWPVLVYSLVVSSDLFDVGQF